MNLKKNRFSALIAAVIILVIIAGTVVTSTKRQRTLDQRPTDQSRAVTAAATVSDKVESTKTSSKVPDKARQFIRALRASAMKVSDVQALCLENAAVLEQLRQLGADAIPVYLDEIADKNSPSLLRILLIEALAHTAGRNDARVGPALMAIIADPTDEKAVRMQALLWIPETGNQTDGPKLLAMLPQQTDADLEFGIVRSLRGFKIAGSVDTLAGELSDEKSHLIRIAAYHAIAHQGDDAALTLLQKSVAARLADGSRESDAQGNAVAVHGVLALGELPNSRSLAELESIAMNPANSVSVRSTAFDSIAAIGGAEAQQVVSRAMKTESNDAVLVYIAHAVATLGDGSDAAACLEKAATISDNYTKNELRQAAHAIEQRPQR